MLSTSFSTPSRWKRCSKPQTNTDMPRLRSAKPVSARALVSPVRVSPWLITNADTPLPMETRYLAGWKTEIWMTIEYLCWILIQISPKTRALDEYLAADTTALQLVSSLPLNLAHKPPGVKCPHLHTNYIEGKSSAVSVRSILFVMGATFERRIACFWMLFSKRFRTNLALPKFSSSCLIVLTITL